MAFTGEANQAKGNNDWMITVEEFKRSLDELYKHHYILIDHMMHMISILNLLKEIT